MSREGLGCYLEGLKREGYKVIALEQSASSKPLHAFAFPKKTALLLGAEKEGLPASLMKTADYCVEIPQVINTNI